MNQNAQTGEADTITVREKIREIIFGVETKPGKYFDLMLIAAILLSVFAVLLDSVASFQKSHHDLLAVLEWTFTILFTLEYLLRLYSTESIRRYVFSFYGLVDLFSILPTYLAFFHPEASYLIVIRVLRVLRIFRVLKLIRYIGEANILVRALLQSRRKVLVFLFSVMALNIIFGSMMYLVEGPGNGFNNIPVSIYWSIVTMTTVGYGDITPLTVLGKFIASAAMITGYAIIAVPTGIVSSELINEYQAMKDDEGIDYSIVCVNCKRKGHDMDAAYCKQCGHALPQI